MPWDTRGMSRAGSGGMSRGCDMAEGTLPEGTVLFKVAAGATVETAVVIEKSGVDRSLLSGWRSTLRGVFAATTRGGGRVGDRVWGGRTPSCRRKDG